MPNTDGQVEDYYSVALSKGVRQFLSITDACEKID